MKRWPYMILYLLTITHQMLYSCMYTKVSEIYIFTLAQCVHPKPYTCTRCNQCSSFMDMLNHGKKREI
jgi:hypothetical protein